MVSENFKKRCNALDVKVINILLGMIPETWFSIRLVVTKIDGSDGEQSFPISIDSPEGKSGTIMPPDQLYPIIFSHHDLFVAEAKPWKSVTYNAYWSDDIESWRYSVDYAYD